MRIELLLSEKDSRHLAALFKKRNLVIDEFIKIDSTIKLRSTDPVIIVAIIAATSGTLNIILAGLLAIAKDKKSGRIVIKAKNGKTLEIPADTPDEKIDKFIEIINSLDTPKIFLP